MLNNNNVVTSYCMKVEFLKVLIKKRFWLTEISIKILILFYTSLTKEQY